MGREGIKVDKNAPLLSATAAPATFTPLVWDTLGHIGPAAAAFLREEFHRPALAAARAGLLRDVSICHLAIGGDGGTRGVRQLLWARGRARRRVAGAGEVYVGLARVG